MGTIRFGDGFDLDATAYELRRQGRVVRLERIPMEILVLLIERRDQLVTREEIVARVWRQGVFVETDNSINVAMRKLRTALRDDPKDPRFIRTVLAKGYRFIAPIEAEAIPLPASEGPPATTAARRRPPWWLLVLAAVVVLGAHGPWLPAWETYFYGRAGRRAEAERAFREIAPAIGETRLDPPLIYATAHLGLGENDQAIAWLERACRDRSGALIPMKVDPIFDPLRGDPRFAELLRCAGFTP